MQPSGSSKPLVPATLFGVFFPENIKVFISVRLQHCVVYTPQFLYLETYRMEKWGENTLPSLSTFHEYLPSVKIWELDCRTLVHDKKDDMGTTFSM